MGKKKTKKDTVKLYSEGLYIFSFLFENSSIKIFGQPILIRLSKDKKSLIEISLIFLLVFRLYVQNLLSEKKFNKQTIKTKK